jgi:DNA recombination protein RmuC
MLERQNVRQSCQDRHMSSPLTIILGLLIGLFLGGVIGYLISSTKSKASLAEAKFIKTKFEEDQKAQLVDAKLEGKIESLVNQFKDLTTNINTANDSRNKWQIQFDSEIKNMQNNNASLLNQSTKLADALSNSQARGKYGEAQLENLLQNAGLVEDIDYKKQSGSTNTDEKGGIPDIKIEMPGGLTVFIDSKFPFARYFEAIAEDNLEKRTTLMKSHASDLRKHIEQLAKRKYDAKEGSATFVVVFVPFESIMAEALLADPKLLNDSLELRVIAATPSSMLGLLRTIGMGFKQIKLADEAILIKNAATKLVDKLLTSHESINTLGKRLSSTTAAFNSMAGTVRSTVSPDLREMMGMGISDKKVPQISMIQDTVRSLGGNYEESDIHEGVVIDGKLELGNEDE